MTTLLVGIGNAFRSDDGVGPVVVRAAARALAGGEATGSAAEVDIVELADPASLIDAIEGADRAVVVDAMASGRSPGAVTTIDATHDPLPATGWAAGGTHALGLAAAIELGRTLGRLPGRLLVVGVEVGDTRPGDRLTPDVAAAVTPAVDAVLAALRSPAG